MILPLSKITDYPAQWTRQPPDIVMRNDRIGMVQHVVTCDRRGTPRYDQPLLLIKPGVVCIVRDENQQLVVLKRYRETCSRNLSRRPMPIMYGSQCGITGLEFVRGGCEREESTLQAARREVEEETSLQVESAIRLGTINPDTALFAYPNDVYLVNVCRRRASNRPADPNEDIQVCFKSLKELLSLVRQDTIFCGLTKAALACYLAFIAD
jgi:8-oxo-dGTP pyrophosphatase MutT (NUDIX family)